MLAETKLRDFVEAVAAKTPTPGGGSVAAAAGAMGAALGIMAARFSEGQKPTEAAAALEPIKDEFLKFVDADAEAYSLVKSAYGLPKGSDETKRRRRDAIQNALKEAADVPLRGMLTSVRALEVVLRYASECNKNLISDLAGAAIMLEACLLGCSLNVKINAMGIEDKERAAKLEQEAARLVGEGSRLRMEVLKSVEKFYGGK